MATTTPTDKRPAWRTLARQHGQKVLALGLWLLVVGAGVLYTSTNDLSVLELLTQSVRWLLHPWYGPLLYLAIYTFRPLLLFSATVITVLAGALYGPLGIVWVIVGSNLSATVAYGVGHFLGQGILDRPGAESVIQRFAVRLRQNSFETVLVMRFLFLPYDLVNYLAGFLRIGWRPFIVATALGSLPGSVSFVLFGASIELEELFMGRLPSLNAWTLGASLLVFGISLGLSRLFRQREERRRPPL